MMFPIHGPKQALLVAQSSKEREFEEKDQIKGILNVRVSSFRIIRHKTTRKPPRVIVLDLLGYWP